MLILYTFLNQLRVRKNIRHKDDRITSFYTGEKDQEGATADGNADTEEELEDRPEGLGLVHGDDYEYEGDDSQDFSEVGSIQGDDANSPNKKVHTIKENLF